MDDMDLETAKRFIGKWLGSTASELPTSQSFLNDSCEGQVHFLPSQTEPDPVMAQLEMLVALGRAGMRKDGVVGMGR